MAALSEAEEQFLRVLFAHVLERQRVYVAERGETLELSLRAARLLSRVLRSPSAAAALLPFDLAPDAAAVASALSRVQSLGVTAPSPLGSACDLSLFASLRELRLVRVKPSLVANLRSLSKQLRAFEVAGAVAALAEALDVRWTGSSQGVFVPSAAGAPPLDPHLPGFDAELEQLRREGVWARLERFGVEGNFVPRTDPTLQLLTGVRSMSLAGNLLTRVAHLQACYRLELLALERNAIDSVAGIAEQVGNVRTLVLRGNRLQSTEGLEHLLGLSFLDLGENRIADIAEVARLAQLPLLAALWLDGNPLAAQKGYRGAVCAVFAERLHELTIDGDPPSEKELQRALDVQAANLRRRRTVSAPAPLPPEQLSLVGAAIAAATAAEDAASSSSPTRQRNSALGSVQTPGKRKKRKKKVAVVLDAPEESEKSRQEHISESPTTMSSSLNTPRGVSWRERIEGIKSAAGDKYLLVIDELVPPDRPAKQEAEQHQEPASPAMPVPESVPQSQHRRASSVDSSGSPSSGLRSTSSPVSSFPSGSLGLSEPVPEPAPSSVASVVAEEHTNVQHSSPTLPPPSPPSGPMPQPEETHLPPAADPVFPSPAPASDLKPQDTAPNPRPQDHPAAPTEAPLTEQDSQKAAITRQTSDTQFQMSPPRMSSQHPSPEAPPVFITSPRSPIRPVQTPSRALSPAELLISAEHPGSVLEDPLNTFVRDDSFVQEWLSSRVFKGEEDEFFLFALPCANHFRFGSSGGDQEHPAVALLSTRRVHIISTGKTLLTNPVDITKGAVTSTLSIADMRRVTIGPSYQYIRIELLAASHVLVTRVHERTHWFVDALVQRAHGMVERCGVPLDMGFSTRVTAQNFANEVLRPRRGKGSMAATLAPPAQIMLYVLVLERTGSRQHQRTLVATKTSLYLCSEDLSRWPPLMGLAPASSPHFASARSELAISDLSGAYASAADQSTLVIEGDQGTSSVAWQIVFGSAKERATALSAIKRLYQGLMKVPLEVRVAK